MYPLSYFRYFAIFPTSQIKKEAQCLEIMGRPRRASASLAVDNADVVAPQVNSPRELILINDIFKLLSQGKKRGRPSTSRPSSAASGDLNGGEATKKRKTDVDDSPLVLTFRHTR